MTTPNNRLRVEALLAQAHASVHELEVLRRQLLRCGIVDDDLPTPVHLKAFALLDDLCRGDLVQDLSSNWGAFLDRGLVREESPDQVPFTPTLRLLSHIRSHLDAIQTLDMALASDADHPEVPAGMLRIEGRTSACYWGELIELRVSASPDVLALRIHADEVLDMDPLLFRRGALPISEPISLIADEGQLFFTVKTDVGIFRQVLPVRLAQSVEEIWQS